ncbi:MAG: aldehyde dehydrogenase family protein [Bacteroidia bacterium]
MGRLIDELFLAQNQFFKSGATRAYKFRKEQIQKLKTALLKNEDKILAALYADLRKSPFEAYSSEITTLKMELDFTLNHLQSWMMDEYVDTPLIHWPASSKVIKEPKGLILIISPWNYPFMLAISPLISAIAAGNCCIIKPSEISSHTSKLIKSLIEEIFPQEFVAVIEGEGKVLGPLLIENHHFDHIFFTGSPSIGKEIMRMASNSLSPVTLELGGKSPAIVCKDTNIKVAAKRIAWGKFWNAGQTCIAPDYVLVEESIQEQFIVELKSAIKEFYGSDPQTSADYGRIISLKHFSQIKKYLQDGDIAFGGKHDELDLYIEPTILINTGLSTSVMRSEIFGPVLPIIPYSNEREVLEIVEHNPYPLACYIFTRNKKTEKFFLTNIRFGGGGINIPLIHFAHTELPLEGIGTSGNGNYHGKSGFDTFSHSKSIMKSGYFPDVALKYPPFIKLNKWIKRFL